MKYEQMNNLPIELTQATIEDYKRLIPAMRFAIKKANYLSYQMLKFDILNNNCYLLKQNNKIIALCSLVFDNQYKMYYIKRLVITNKINLHKGYGKEIIKSIITKVPKGSVVAATPWNDNTPMKRLLESLGFELRYQIDENFLLYTTTIW